MKIGIDTFGCEHGKSGNGSYLINFISNLPSSDDLQFELFGNEIDKYTYNSNNGIPFVSVDIPDSLKAMRKWHKRKLPKFIKKNAYDAVIYPACEQVLPGKMNCKGIVVVNCMLSSKLKTIGRYRQQLKKGLNHAYKIIAPTEFIKKDLTKLGIKAKNIIIVRDGIEHKSFFPQVMEEEIVQINPFAIKTPYFLCPTSITGPDKKHKELIVAFEEFKKRTNSPHRLVIAGEGNEFTEQIHKFAYESSVASDIFITGYFPQESLPKLYGAADACIFPSINEGVGLPVLEAMACGVPVLCSSSGALQEVGEDAPIYFNSDNKDEIVNAMEMVVINKNIRDRMIEKGIKEASGYSWEKTVKQTLDVL